MKLWVLNHEWDCVLDLVRGVCVVVYAAGYLCSNFVVGLMLLRLRLLLEVLNPWIRWEKVPLHLRNFSVWTGTRRSNL